MTTYVEDFDTGPGGWMRVVDNYAPIAALPIKDGVVRCQGPWWVDYNHAPPGGGYLQLLMCLVTKGPSGESVREAGGENRFVKGNYPTDFTNARITLRLRGELEAAGTKFSVLLQGSIDGLTSGWVFTGERWKTLDVCVHGQRLRWQRAECIEYFKWREKTKVKKRD